MSEENIEIVRQAFDNLNAFLRGELTSEAFSERIDPQIRWDWHDLPPVPDAPRDLRGAPAVTGFLAQFRSEWVDLGTEPLELIEAPDDRVLGSTRLSGRGRESGVSIEAHPFSSSRSEMERCAKSSSSAIALTPSKPPGCRSRRHGYWFSRGEAIASHLLNPGFWRDEMGQNSVLPFAAHY